MNQQRDQHPQLQQSNIQELGLHPLQTPATPSWNIADKIVKDELSDEKNEDSGVSPGHYTSNSGSPRSRRSSILNYSLSPASSASDSQSMPGPTFDYSPGLYKHDNSHLTFGPISSMEEDEGKNGNQEVDAPTSSKHPYFNFQCPMCLFTCANRSAFSDHLSIHYSSTDVSGCGKVDSARSKDNLNGMDDSRMGSPTISGDRSEYEFEEDISVPRINSQGKVKTYKCKQCDYEFITKLDFWEHSRSHIKVDKLLTCPKCPFVTEYKHHLEYHLRNHFGAKPFKCEKCEYSCVNKSMLSSHMKSHSNVYPYRCLNCTYATKYMHSLKIHLRKYKHQPAMVLNSDGTPNPLPIIDVYGTRRGPKSKSTNKRKEESPYNMQSPLNNNMLSAIPSPLVPSQLMIPTSVPQMGGPMNLSMLNGAPGGINGLNGINNLVPNHANLLSALSYNQFLGYPIPNSIFNEKMAENALKIQAYFDYARSLNNDKVPEDLSLNSNSTENIPPKDFPNSDFKDEKVPVAVETLKVPEKVDEDEKRNNSNKEKLELPQNCVNNVKKTGTSRRKGKAVKLDKHILEKDSDDEQDHAISYNKIVPPTTVPVPVPVPEIKETPSNDESTKADQYRCQFCEISFGNDVMYTVHMGYHGYQNPFTCNMCGHQCADKVSFFLHIAKSKH